ncbi:mediator of RNA polymerase 2 transcription subunit [Blastocystis sp. subtype 4]|uniref:mediator of RNA polymerase 2 transcription subunit n=1 Tax=Blastocystis sp. subtype 4 TaxID=944170 RepID=UPI00071147B5|nr:mediator of RNA polymerase 2 transcription subunit [Blastocystis sp. subtype 4]KNB43038.1 mediator of RNA polymerase 2 transcription subunit [Blastocystis sp. subtype 4]|eukprot:XP_014526481.1 mediator of RNA polymerase 2 transcription subunit [Blastocystis sp. subtype 4]
MSTEAVLGIDFGAEHITAYVSCGDQRLVVSDEHGNRFIDACIYYNHGEIVIGSSVEQLARTSPDRVVYHPLHFLDSRSASPQDNQAIKSEIINGFPVFEIGNADTVEKISLETIMVECFKKVYNLSILTFHKKPMAKDLSEESQKFLLRCARKAKIPNPSILSSHMCAVLRHCENDKTESSANGLVVIVDIPASTASISILNIQNGLYKLLFFKRLDVCIGHSLDSSLFNYVLEDACRRISPDVMDSKKAQSKLQREVHRIKETLSNTNSATIMIESLFDGSDYSLSVTRARFEMLSRVGYGHKYLQFLKKRVLNLRFTIISSAMIPAVQDSMRTLFKERMMIATHPSEVVAEGAAIQAQLLRTSLPVIQQLSMSVVCSMGSQQLTLVEKGEPIPLEREVKTVVMDENEVKRIDIITEEQRVVTSVELQETANNKEIVVFVTANTIIGIVIVIRIIEKDSMFDEYKITIKEKECVCLLQMLYMYGR